MACSIAERKLLGRSSSSSSRQNSTESSSSLVLLTLARSKCEEKFAYCKESNPSSPIIVLRHFSHLPQLYCPVSRQHTRIYLIISGYWHIVFNFPIRFVSAPSCTIWTAAEDQSGSRSGCEPQICRSL